MLHGKKILLGVCGSIAAYKSAFLIRLLVKNGAEVKVIMTPSATSFITPITLSTLSKNPVLMDFTNENSWNSHIELGMWADVFLVAPASANTIAKMTNGICDNLLLATYLSARSPVAIAPAMDEDMWEHLSTQKNIKTLTSFGNKIISVEHGELASGLVGNGRMAEPETIVEFLEKQIFSSLEKKKFAGKKALVTAGATHEPIDPVRFISNHSSGKMGIAIAEELANSGAEVTLILGVASKQTVHPKIKNMVAKTAKEMFNAVVKNFKNADITVMTAAVADFTPKYFSKNKIKKNSATTTLELVKTKDILFELGKNKKKSQLLVGFALETENELENARKKLKEKNLDFIVLNSLADKGAGFQSDTNKITILFKNNKTKKFELKPKSEVAKDIVKEIATLSNA